MTHCLLCGQPLQPKMTWRILLSKSFPNSICEKCDQKFERIPYDSQCEDISLFTYNAVMRDYLHQFKFLQDVALAKVFRQEIYNAIHGQQTIIVPIPMHSEKKKERTFAHVDELLRAAKVPYVHLLNKVTKETQSSKTREERINAAPLFQLMAHAKVEPTRYILVDDIRTTGTTLKHAKSILLENGAKTVTTLTLIKG